VSAPRTDDLATWKNACVNLQFSLGDENTTLWQNRELLLLLVELIVIVLRC
jgi:hypothetical protein